jgi:hypothetical protein
MEMIIAVKSCVIGSFFPRYRHMVTKNKYNKKLLDTIDRKKSNLMQKVQIILTFTLNFAYTPNLRSFVIRLTIDS